MKNFAKFLLLFCIGLCSLVNVGYAQETDENTTSEKSALVIQAGCVLFVGAGHADMARTIVAHAPMPALIVTDIAAEAKSNVTLEGAELPDIVQGLLKEAQERLCDLPDLILISDLEPKPAPRCRDVSKLYNEFPNFKSQLTERFYRYRFSC
jgi:hypothetical protein